MIQPHPEFLTKNDREEFAVLPSEEFVLLQELRDETADLLDPRRAKTEAADAATMTLAEVKNQLGLGEEPMLEVLITS